MKETSADKDQLKELIFWGKDIADRVKLSSGLNLKQMEALSSNQKVRITEATEWQNGVEELLKKIKGGDLPLRYKTIWKVHKEEFEANDGDESTRYARTYERIVSYLEDLEKRP